MTDPFDTIAVPSSLEYLPARVFVRNLDRKASEKDIFTFFSKFGRVCSVRKGPKSKTCAFVTFTNADDASNVYQASSKDLVFHKKQLLIQKSAGKRDATGCNGEDNSKLFDALPNEILQHIFSFLDFKHRIEIELVCKRWRLIGKGIPWSWPTKVVLNSYRYKVDKLDITGVETCTDKVVAAVLSRCNCNLREITLHGSGKLTYQSIDAIGKYCPNLRTLNLEGFQKISVKCLKRLAQRCCNIKVLQLQSFYLLRDEAIAAVLEDCTEVEHLDISYNSRITGECLNFVGKNLQVLHMNMCYKLESAALEKLMTRCQSIRVLHLTNCQLEKDTLLQVFWYFRNTLTELRLDALNRSRTLDAITMLPNLEKLSVYGSGMNDEILKSIAKACVKLVDLNVGSTFVSDVGLRCLAKSAHLKVLHIPFSKHITGEGIEALAAEGRLEKLGAQYVNVLRPDERYGALAKFCANFRFLDASSCKHLSNKLVETFCASVTSGFLKGPVKLVVQETSVTRDVKTCDGLQVSFKAVF